MASTVGFIQTGEISDVIMILPIADHFLEQGWEVVFPIDSRAVPMFQRAAPSINFLPVDCSPSDGREYYLDQPLKLVNEHSCERTILFHSKMSEWMGMDLSDPRLAGSLKYDEYKYAISGVPFSRKWSLDVKRDPVREQRLFDSLQIDGPYICIHDEALDGQLPVPIPAGTSDAFRIIRIEPRTDSIFDWLFTIEHASELIFIDSCFATLVDQLRIAVKKTLVLRNNIWFASVYRGDWRFVFADPGDFVSNSSSYI